MSVVSCHLHLKNLTANAHDRELFNNITISLISGSLLHIHGANGSGKSTLLAMIAGLREHSGNLYWQNNDQKKLCYEDDIFYLGHKQAIKMPLTVNENIQYLQSLHGAALEDTDTILKSLGLQSHTHTLAQHLSQGQQQRLALAPLTWAKQPLWLLDEPLVALDKAAKQWFSAVLNQHLSRQGFIILVSHETLVDINHPIEYLSLGEIHA